MRKFGLVMLTLAVVALGANAAMGQNPAEKTHRVRGPYGPGITTGGICDTQDLTGVTSIDLLGDADNTVISTDLSALCGGVSDVGWVGVVASTVGGSWGSEISTQFSASDGSSASTVQYFTPGSTGTFGPSTGNLGAGVTLLGDMVLRMEFYETFDDNTNSTDANYLAGDLQVQGPPVPVELMGYSID